MDVALFRAIFFASARFDFVDAHQVVEDGEDGKSGCGVDVELGANVPAMSGYGVDGDAELVGNFLV